MMLEDNEKDLAVEQPKDKDKKLASVTVGVSRLHHVEVPNLVMKPIYWSPINDIASVVRATWFYQNTMLPVETEVANRLEIGYEEIKPYLATYQDELNACVENGAAAELKITVPLWPEDNKGRRTSRPPSRLSTKQELGPDLTNDVDNVLRKVPKAGINTAYARQDTSDTTAESQMYVNHSIVFADSEHAQILRPNTAPSESRGRRPLKPIRQGTQIGVAVVRGFDQRAWNKLRPPKNSQTVADARVGAMMSPPTEPGRESAAMGSSKVTDLVLVIHGIGQKLSERMDSFHFTHAINAFRREVNVELARESRYGGTLRKDGGGIMVLPVNWRLTVDFDDVHNKRGNIDPNSRYELSDITPETLPAVRSLISDVMLDIPYYLSHHKPRMISAVIREANRVFRLWCSNNPGFLEAGRVHIIAHSLGSTMAIDILSNQPTLVPKLDTNDARAQPTDKHFEFDTKTLFSCGSPSGFFLLLNKANLVPREGRRKPDAEPATGLCGKHGTYGCLAVDNLYNIIAKNDPVAYQVNAAVDRQYAASLQQAHIPSTTTSLLGKMANALSWSSTTLPSAYSSTVKRPDLNKLPSTVELDHHNFSREEIAEKRMYLLNDNGQIDYFLGSGGGPLEIQYLNMLGAHSSYWILQDFVRFIVVEVGREPGRSHTLPVLRAVKKEEDRDGQAGVMVMLHTSQPILFY